MGIVNAADCGLPNAPGFLRENEAGYLLPEYFRRINRSFGRFMRLFAGSLSIVGGETKKNNLINDENYHWNTINEQYHDTYNFLKSLENNLPHVANYS